MIFEQLTIYINKNVSISRDELTEVLSFFEKVSYPKNETLLSQGEKSQYTYFVCAGCLRFYSMNKDGKEVTRYIAFENQFATDLVGFVSNESSMEHIQVLENAALLQIHHRDFLFLMEKIPAWRSFYMNYLEKAYVNNLKRTFSFTSMSAAERYEQLLRVNSKIVKRLPNKVVASYINVSQETLSRLKTK